MEQPIVRIQDLHKSFGSLEVLKGVDLEVNKGEVVVILGPSGSGKSTMLRCINRLEESTSGKIFFEDQEITDPKTNINEIREKIGMVFQSFNLFPHLTAKGNVMLAQQKVLKRSKAEAEKAALENLDAVGLGRQGRLLPGPALRWPAAARRDRAGARDEPARDALRRGHLGARPRARSRRSRRHEAARQGRHDDDRRHPRDGLRARRGRPRRLHGRGNRPRAGHAGRGIRPSRRASARRTSWVTSPRRGKLRSFRYPSLRQPDAARGIFLVQT